MSGMIISLCNCRCQCLTLFLILKQRRYIIGRETLYIFIDGFCNVLRVRNSLDDSLCSQYDVTCREDTGACRLSVFVRKEKTVLGGLKVSCGVHKLGLRSLAYGNDRRIGPEEFRFVFLDMILPSSSRMFSSRTGPSSVISRVLLPKRNSAPSSFAYSASSSLESILSRLAISVTCLVPFLSSVLATSIAVLPIPMIATLSPRW